VLGSTPNPDGAFVVQAVRGLLGETDTVLREGRILRCDRDPNWTAAMYAVLGTAGVRVVRTPPASPNGNARAERFVQSIKEECLDRVVPLGEWH
jgi:putative transposase